jgi:phosphoribosyl 1,2-cyclic phosphate phosphodiesterase
VYIESGDKAIVIDTGPDFRQQMLREDIDHLDAVLLTHSHRDHLAGLDDIRAFNYLQERDMPIFSSKESLERIRVEFDYVFAKFQYPGIPKLQLREIDSRPFNAEGIDVTPLPVLHHQMRVLGFRIGPFSYITDANSIPDQTVALLKGTEVLVLNALQQQKHLSHFNLEEAVEVAMQIGARKTYFTHVSHKLGLHKLVDGSLPSSISLAYDGLTITL